ncbi:MAG: purine-binding chemotaxis protein CheW [Phycisphaerales bacterium]|nr:purine-binding chemotaxis protein CheW [Phycisphaerales bacterium]
MSTTTTGDGNENKFLSFRIGREEFGVEILRVREIIGVIDVTPLPQTPDYVKGVINLRGKIIPVIELRAKLGLPPMEYTEETCIIVVEVSDGGDECFHMGVIVDSVSEVMDIPPDSIEPAPRFGGNLNTSYILGMGKVKEHVLVLLEIDRVMTHKDIGAMAEAARAESAGGPLQPVGQGVAQAQGAASAA